MLAKTEIPCDDADQAADQFATTLRTFQEHARAIASGKAEGDRFTWFLASEYEWEMEMACQWLVESSTSRLSEHDKATLRHFLDSMPAVREAIISGRQAASHRPQNSSSPEWSDWLKIAAMPSWNHFTVRTAILLSQLGNPAQNDKNFFARD